MKEYPTWVNTTAMAANRRKLVRLSNRDTSLGPAPLASFSFREATVVVGIGKVLWVRLIELVTRTQGEVKKDST